MKRLFVFLLIIFLLAGCSPRDPELPEINPVVLTSGEAIGEIYNLNVIPKYGVIVADENYMVPSEEWFRDKFPGILWDFQKDMRATFWVSEENDCDNFAKLGAGFAQLLHHNTGNKVRETSLTVGEFHYYSETLKTMHAIVFALVRSKDGKYKVLFLEPQKCKIITLTEYEINSCRNWIL